MRHFSWTYLIVALCTVLLGGETADAKKLIGIKLWPNNVGVFSKECSPHAGSGTQQFQAIGVFDDGSEEDYTTKVGWSLEANPLPDQDFLPHEVASIDKNGLLTVKSSWGRVVVKATYPPPPPASASMISALLLNQNLIKKRKRELPLIPIYYLLLLQNKDEKASLVSYSTPAFSLDRDNGPLSGGNIVLLKSKYLDGDNEKQALQVIFNGVKGRILAQQDNTIYAVVGQNTSPGPGNVELTFTDGVKATMKNGYTYNPPGKIESAIMFNDTVMITGSGLGSGDDIYKVVLSGDQVEILFQSNSAVYVRSSKHGYITVEVYSQRFGKTKKKIMVTSPLTYAKKDAAKIGDPTMVEDHIPAFTPSFLLNVQ